MGDIRDPAASAPDRSRWVWALTAAALAAAVVTITIGPGGGSSRAATPSVSPAPLSPDPAPPPIRHVFIIVLENQSASTTFAKNSAAPYLARTLRSEGAYLPNYYGIGHESNDNYIAMISGQPPNGDNQADCQFYTDFPAAATGQYGAQEGLGCVYPAGIPTIAGQLQQSHHTWRDYNEDMGNTPTREARRCGHPAPQLVGRHADRHRLGPVRHPA